MRTPNSVLAIVAAGLLGSGCSKPKTIERKPAQPVKTQAVTAAAPAPGVRYSASIEPYEQVTLAFKASGYVTDVLRRTGADGSRRTLQPGDRVTRGTMLARVHDADYREHVYQGRARLAEGEASLVKARLDLERARTLFGADSLTKPELDAAQAAFDGAEARLASVRADIELAESALRDCSLVAPSAGVVLERRIEVGTLAGAGTVGFVIGDMSSVKARFGIPDSTIHVVKLGDTIGVSVEAVAEALFTGRVTAIAPAADPQSRVFDVEVTIPNTDGQLRPGMIGTVTMSPRESQASAANRPLTVPLTAIVRASAGVGQYAVLVVHRQQTGDIARVRPVELGEVLGNTITVLKGLSAGEHVVVSGATLLVDGDPVRVMP